MRKHLLFISFLLLLLLLLFSPSSFASFEFESNGNYYIVPDLPESIGDFKCYMIGYNSDNNVYFLNVCDIDINTDNNCVLNPSTNCLCFVYKELRIYHYSPSGTGDISTSWVLADSRSYPSQSYWHLTSIGRPNDVQQIIYSNINIYHSGDEQEGELFYRADGVAPFIADSDKLLSTLKHDYILVLPGSLDVLHDDINFVIRQKKTIDAGSGISYDKLEVVYNTTLNSASPYCNYAESGGVREFWFEVDVGDIRSSHEFLSGSTYIFSLEYTDFAGFARYVDYEVTMTGQTTEDVLTDGLLNLQVTISESNKQLLQAERETTAAINEQTEVNRGIFERIGELLSYINPFSENFFAYKIIELLVDALKGLFVPSERFY